MRISQKMTAGWLALSMILFAVRSEGQTTVSALPTYFDVKSMMPTSPDAAILGRFGEVPIGHYTGTANISVPIYTIEDKEANFSLPIVLSYHSSGVKVEDQGGVAGLGWSLSAEGSIIQIVNGKEDTLDDIVAEDPTGYATLKDGMILGAYSKRSSVGTTVWPCGSGPGDGDDPVSMGLAMQGDGQPDLYAYNFAGYSGKFYVNPETHQPTLLDEKVPLTFVRTGFHTWKAITLDGNVFNFGALEYSNTDATGANFSGYTAKLTSVQLNDGKTVTFNYAPGYYEWYNYSENFHIPYIFGLTPATEVGVIPSLHTSLNNIQYLTSIQANNVTVNFNLAGRSDLFGLDPTYNTYFPERVNSIDIIDPVLNRKLKTFQLYASYFPYSSNGGSYQAVSSSTTYIGLRLRLDSVQEMGYSASGNAISEPPYRFYYDQTYTLPTKTSFSKDFWGYYNGINNSQLTPDLTFMRDVSCTGYPYDSVSANLLSLVQGANRAPDRNMMTAGMLKQVTYPTGGYTVFSYEPNSFTNFLYPDQQKIKDATHLGFIADNNLSTDVTTTPAIGFTSGCGVIHYNISIGAGANPTVTFDALLPAYVQLTQTTPAGSTTVLQTWQLSTTEESGFNGSYSWSGEVQLPYQSGYTYALTASLPDNLGPQGSGSNNASVTCNYNYYNLPDSDKATSYGGGVRVNMVQDFDAEGNVTSTKVLKYINADGTPSGLLMSPVQYLDDRPMTFINQLAPTGNGSVEFQEGSQAIDFMTSESMVPYSDGAMGALVGYSRVEEWELAPDGSNNGKHVYYYHNVPSQTMIDLPDNPDLLNGSMVREEIWNSSGDTIQTKTYTYADNYAMQNMPPPVFDGIKTIPAFYGAGPCSFSGTGAANSPNYSLIPYTWVNFYPLTANWYLPSGKTTNYYNSGSALSTTETYKYNSLGQLIETDSYNSKGEPTALQVIYPDDTTGAQASLLEFSGLWSHVLMDRDWVNGSLMAQNSFVYGLQNTQLVRDSTVRIFNGNTPFTDVSFGQYGSFKTLMQYTQRGQTSSILWDYANELPIAKISNALQSDVAYTSFEADGSGNWTVPDTTRIRSAWMTGAQAYPLNNNNSISRTGLNSSQTYIVSYWSMGGSLNVNGTSATAGTTVGGWTYYEHKVSGATTITVSGNATIDELRLFPKGSLMTTYTHAPLIGITSECTPTNYITYYNYDGLGRLVTIQDLRGNIIKTYQYNYRK